VSQVLTVDSHCHLAGPEYAADLDDVVRRARDAGVSQALVILAADDGEELARASAVTSAWPETRFSIGVHPHAAGRFSSRPEDAAAAVEAAIGAQPLAVAVGEIGLDYHYDFAPRDAQRSVFAAQIRLARRLRLPIVIHTREADEETFRVLAEEGGSEAGGVFHCFTGDVDTARRVLDIGFCVSLAGIVTFPRAAALQEVARMVPMDRLLIETDSPYLAPVPHRGRRNEPAHVVRVAEMVGALRGSSAADVGEAARQNFERLFVARQV
jgi:TatD DNase family protein